MARTQDTPSDAELQEALQALGIDVPYYSAHRGTDGSILIVTRNGAHVYKRPTPTRSGKRRKTP